ncbi:hypothetical protein L4X63_00035 [Geomonas sp. Red32]|uniref:hypothetical protein n=1 Tax=Geomonas sp. Red32 TaxID=2912856 RepID=UPI00202CC19D|nr:hypothetical protein [Geomonas sp. Red32]MCM0079969.1 hypothetical protein [Geomonas sp. Red32]
MVKGISGIVKSLKSVDLRLPVLLLLVALLAGCAETKNAQTGPVFFPPPPDEPHIQYLTGISNSADLTGKQSIFSRLLTGGTQTVVRLSKPYGVAVHGGKIYVCDIGASQIVVIDMVNKTMKNLNEEIGAAELKKPISVTVDDDGYVYVADNGRKDIAVYDADGKYVKSMGKDLGTTRSIIAVYAYKDYLLALDNRLGEIFVMERKSGDLISTLGRNPDKSKNMALPNGMTVDSKGNIHVVNIGNGKVKEYDLDGHLLSEFGRMGDGFGEFTRPRGITVDDEGNIFIVDAGHQVVQVFNSQRRLLGFFGRPGLPAGSLNLPAGIVVTKENLPLFQKYAAPGFKLNQVVIVANQYASPINYSLAFYGMGEMEKKPEDKAKKEKADVKAKKPEEKGAAAPAAAPAATPAATPAAK